MDTLLTNGDRSMHLVDLRGDLQTQGRVDAVYSTAGARIRAAIANRACSGAISGDQTIGGYAADIRGLQPYALV